MTWIAHSRGLPLELSLLIGEFGKHYKNMKHQTFCNLLEIKRFIYPLFFLIKNLIV